MDINQREAIRCQRKSLVAWKGGRSMKWPDQFFQLWLTADYFERMSKFLTQDLIPTVLMILFLAAGMVLVNVLLAT